MVFFFSSRRRHTRFDCDWSSDVCSSDLFNKYNPNPSFTPKWSDKPLLKSWEKTKPTLGWPRQTDSLCPDCEEARERSEEHTSELQSQSNLVCRLLLEKKKIIQNIITSTPTVHTTDACT